MALDDVCKNEAQQTVKLAHTRTLNEAFTQVLEFEAFNQLLRASRQRGTEMNVHIEPCGHGTD